MNPIQICHCGSKNTFDTCCKVYISLQKQPETSEQLMRSRFTAFKLRAHQYLINTQHSKHKLTINDFDITIDWLGLSVIPPKKQDDAYVEFIAFYKSTNNQKIQQLHERSYFEKTNNQWLYISGKPLTNIKLNRNQPCFCGSSKKVKNCHPI